MDNTVAYGKAKAYAGLFGCNERSAELVYYFRRYTGSLVFYR